MNTYDFVRVGPVSGQKQTHRNEKHAPCSRGIWALPKVAGNDVYYLGVQWWREAKDENTRTFIRKNNLRKTIKLDMTADVWHHMNGYWEKCSVREYFKRLEHLLHHRKSCIDGEYIEVFIKM